jgi:hypothetical protein
MLYFWLIPAAILLVVLIWVLYGLATKRKGAGVRLSGETLLDKTDGTAEREAPLRPRIDRTKQEQRTD